MKLKDGISFSFKDELARIGSTPLRSHPSAFFWQKSLSIDNQFCNAVVRAGYLSWEQMLNASCRYCIGASKKHGVIFWQIDHEGRVHDGKVMYYLPNCHRDKSKDAHPTWISALLAKRDPFHNTAHNSSHCFFGLHLLMADGTRQNASIAIVEAEKTAFILSELYPQSVWLASGGLGEVQPDKFRPLRGCKIVMFPDTDPDGIAFKRWNEAANTVMHSPFWEDSPPIRVSHLLETHATPDQKQRKIDLVDFLFESHKE
jgi:hypothetical protein